MAFIDTTFITEWSTSPYALAVLSALSFSESAFFIIPPELLLIPMALISPQLAIAYGLLTTVTSVLGAAFGYFLGKKGGKPILVKLFGEEKLQTVKHMFQKYDTTAVFISAFTPIPFKVFTIGAGVFDLAFWKFLFVSLLGRGTRYLLLAGLIAVYGESIRYFLEHQFDKAVAVVTVIGIVGFFAYKFGIPYFEKMFGTLSLKDRVVLFFKKRK